MKKFVLFFGLCILAVFLFSCSKKRMHQHKEWGAFFESNGVQGCLMLHDYYNATFDVYGLGAIQKRVLPGESFNVVLALAGLETGAVSDTNMVIKDSAVSKDLAGITLAEAFRTGNTAYFQWVAQKIGKDRMQYWIDSTYYGNTRMNNNLTTFWLDNTLRVSPDEQMGLMELLYNGKLAYQPRTQKLVRGLLVQKISHDDTLSYEQGVGHRKDKKIGWLSGWLKTKDNHYFFVIKTLADDTLSDLKKRDINILYKLLDAKGLVSETGRLK